MVNTVTDAASYAPRVAPGSLASIFGSNLAGSTDQASSTPLPISLGGTTVTISGKQVPLIYVSATQVNFQVPSSLASGQSSLVVTSSGGTSSAFSFTVSSQAPAIFQYGTNHAVAQNTDSSHSINADKTPAQAGSVITVYLTGQGAVDNAVADGTATPSSPLSKATATATATIQGQKATVEFLGLAPGFVGLAQANVQVPNLPSGDYPLVLTVGGLVSASAIVSVSGSGNAFTTPLAFAGSVSFSNTANSSVALYGNTLYVCGPNNIVIVNVADATKPTVVGEFGNSALSGNGTVCAINTTATPPFLADVVRPPGSNVSFAVFDVTNPDSPNLLTVAATNYPDVVDLSFYATYGFVSTNYLTYYVSNHNVIAQNGDFLAFDFSAPSNPTFIAIVQPVSGVPASNNVNLKPYAAVVAPTTAYIATSTATGSSTAGEGALSVIDTTSPYALTPVTQILAPNTTILLSFDVSGSTLLACGNSLGQRNPGNPDFDFMGNLTLTTMNISSIESPVVEASIDTGLPGNGTRHTVAFNTAIFAIVHNPPITDNGGPATLMIVDARTPTNPVLYPIQTQFGFSGILTTTTGYLFAPTVNGLNVYTLQLQ